MSIRLKKEDFLKKEKLEVPETLKQYDKAKECYLRIKKNPDKQVQDMADQKLSELKKSTK